MTVADWMRLIPTQQIHDETERLGGQEKLVAEFAALVKWRLKGAKPARSFTKCDKCGDESNSDPNLQCGRVEPESWDGPCQGVYR